MIYQRMGNISLEPQEMMIGVYCLVNTEVVHDAYLSTFQSRKEAESKINTLKTRRAWIILRRQASSFNSGEKELIDKWEESLMKLHVFKVRSELGSSKVVENLRNEWKLRVIGNDDCFVEYKNNIFFAFSKKDNQQMLSHYDFVNLVETAINSQ